MAKKNSSTASSSSSSNKSTVQSTKATNNNQTAAKKVINNKNSSSSSSTATNTTTNTTTTTTDNNNNNKKKKVVVPQQATTTTASSSSSASSSSQQQQQKTKKQQNDKSSTKEVSTTTTTLPSFLDSIPMLKTGALGFILKPGSSVHPTTISMLYVVLFALLGALAFLYILPNIPPIHIFVLAFLAVGLFVSVQYVLPELRKINYSAPIIPEHKRVAIPDTSKQQLFTLEEKMQAAQQKNKKQQ